MDFGSHNSKDWRFRMKGMLGGALVIVALLCTISSRTKAQVPNCIESFQCSWNSIWGDIACEPAIPQGATNCVPGNSWTLTCQVPSPLCAPPKAYQETQPHCGANCSQPINLSTGDTFIKQTDISLPGLGGGLTLVRTWNSIWPSTQTASQVGLFGPNWRSNFEERVFLGSDNYMKYARGDGSFWSFGYYGGPYIVSAPTNESATLTAGTSYWTITFKNGEQRQFDNTSGNLIAIVDRNGNTMSLSYDSVGRLVTITDPASRHLYFSYGSPTSFLVTSVTSDFGVSTSYTYNSQGLLLQVTEPDQSTLNFDYNSQSLIADVKDSNGIILEAHTYDSSGRGLTSTRANGVESVTVSYNNQ